MSVTFLSTTDYPTGQIIEFNIEAAKDRKNEAINAINSQLKLQEELGYGKIFNQTNTGDLWYVNPKGTIARLISASQLELFRLWDNQKLLPSAEQLETLTQIGGLPTPPFSLYPDTLEFPAKITTTTGQEIDLCLFHFSPAPPFQRHFKKVLLLSDIVDIKPSEFALSHSLRLASVLAEEIRMSFYPFMVRTNKGKYITYNGITQFASNGEIKGDEIAGDIEFTYDLFDTVSDVSFDDMTFIVGKWDDRLNTLFKEYRQRIHNVTTSIKSSPKDEHTWWQKIKNHISVVIR